MLGVLGILGVFGHGDGGWEEEEEKEKAALQMTKPSRTVSRRHYGELL
jgi:hypothetical protein